MTRLPAIACLAGATLLAFAAGAAPAADQPAPDQDPDVAEVRAYQLTQEKIDKLAAANEALSKLTKADPALRRQMENDDDDRSIEQMTKNLATKYPRAAKAIEGAGLKVREFVVLELAFTNDLLIVGLKRQGLLKAYPPGTITAENIAFVEQHYDKLKALADQFEADDGADDGDE